MFTALSRIASLVLGGSLPTSVAVAAGPPIRLGQSAVVDGPRVRPMKVVEDSRCPMNARCVWAGRIVVRTRVSGGHWSKTIDLTLGKPEPVADGRITLSAVTPDRIAGERLYPRRLRFTYEFEGGL